jgi:hypothetical protein
MRFSPICEGSLQVATLPLGSRITATTYYSDYTVKQQSSEIDSLDIEIRNGLAEKPRGHGSKRVGTVGDENTKLPPRAPRSALALAEQRPELGGRGVRTVDDGHVSMDQLLGLLGDDALEKGVMGTSEHDGVDPRVDERLKVTPGSQSGYLATDPAFLGQRHQQGRGLGEDPNTGVLGLNRALVGTGGDGPGSRENPDSRIPTRCDARPRSRLDYADDGDREPLS